MKLHWLQHVPFEGLGYIEQWADGRGAAITRTRLFENEPLPSLDSLDWLIVMGGPMGIHDHEQHPWLVPEKQFIRDAIIAGKTVVGICLGAQLMADVLGAKVYPGPEKEIGWFPIERDKAAAELMPDQLTVFHWHGDTFEIPDGATALASSLPGINQGFVYGDKAVGLQFHMETTPESMESLIENCGHELVESPYIQSAGEIRAGASHIAEVNAVLHDLLDALA